MKTVLFTGWDKPYDALADVTVRYMNAYCARYSACRRLMEFAAFTDPPPGLNMYWTGVARGLELLRDGYDRVMYLDVDQLITNRMQFFDFIPAFGFHYSKDWGTDATDPWHFSACGWIAHHDCIPMFEDVLAMAPEWMDKPFQEQGPWQEWMRKRIERLSLLDAETAEPAWNAGLNLHPRRVFNAVPDEVSPGNVPEPWQPGDFAAHLTMLPMEERLKLARKFC